MDLQQIYSLIESGEKRAEVRHGEVVRTLVKLGERVDALESDKDRREGAEEVLKKRMPQWAYGLLFVLLSLTGGASASSLKDVLLGLF